MLAYSSLSLDSFKSCFSFPLDIINLGSGVVGSSLEFSSFSLDIVDLDISISSRYKSSHSASDVLRASFYSESNLSS